MDTHTATPVLDHLLDPVADCLTPEVARALVDLRAQPEVQARIEELAAKANQATLSPSEQAEYRAIVETIDFISLLQAKARARLSPSDRP